MKFLILLLFIRLLLGQQELNPIPHIVIQSDYFFSIDRYQDQLFGGTFDWQTIYQFDLNSYQQIQNRSLNLLTTTYNSLKAYKGYLYMGAWYQTTRNYYEFVRVPINQFQAPTLNISTADLVNCFAFYQNYMFVGTGSSVDQYSLDTLQTIGSVHSLNVYVLLVYNQSLFVGGSPIQERSVFHLTQTLGSYYGNGNTECLTAQNGSLFSGFSDGSVFHWDINTKLLINTTLGHTAQVYGLAVYGDYLFSGSWDNYWAQWVIETNQLYRKVYNGNAVYNILIFLPYILTSGPGGLLRYRIPEYGNLTLAIDFSQDNVYTSTETQQSTLLAQSKTTVIQQTSLIKTVELQTTVSSEILYNNQTFKIDPLASQTQHPLQIIPSQQNELQLILIIIAVIGSALLLIVGILIYILISRKRNKNNETESNTNIASTSITTTTSSSTTMNSTFTSLTTGKDSLDMTSSSLATDSTLIATKNAYSIPGHLQLNSEEIVIKKEVAKGGQGVISLAEILNPGFQKKYQTKQVVVKSTGRNFDALSQREQMIFNQELSIIHFYKERSGFIRIYGYTLNPAALILKYYPVGNMENLICKRGRFADLVTTKYFILFFMKEFANTIYYLHDSGFVHCDIKPQNILLELDQTGWPHPILSDFGITQIVSEKVLKVKAMKVESLKGFSLHYAAPEQIKQLRDKVIKPFSPEVTKKRDVYAIAGLIYGLMMKKEPWYK